MNDAIVSDSASHALPLADANPAVTAYTFLRHTGFILDELSAQGMVLWLDENDRWHWRWQGTELQSENGFWAIGEAVVDAVIGRFPETFSTNVKSSEDKAG